MRMKLHGELRFEITTCTCCVGSRLLLSSLTKVAGKYYTKRYSTHGYLRTHSKFSTQPMYKVANYLQSNLTTVLCTHLLLNIHGTDTLGGTVHVPSSPCAKQYMYQTVNVPNSTCTRLSMYQTVHVPDCQCAKQYMYQTVNVPNSTCTRLSMYQTVHVPDCQCTKQYMYQTVNVPNSTCTRLSMYQTVHVPDC